MDLLAAADFLLSNYEIGILNNCAIDYLNQIQSMAITHPSFI